MRWAISSYWVLYNHLGFIDIKESFSGEILVHIALLQQWRRVVAYDDRLTHELDAVVSCVRLRYRAFACETALDLDAVN